MDLRASRTRRRLQEALLGLARERGVGSISVGEITAAAGLNRSTFYAHYPDKGTLLADALEQSAREAAAVVDTFERREPPTQALVRLLTHMEAHADLYGPVLAGTGRGGALVGLSSPIRDAVVVGTARRDDAGKGAVPIDIIAAGVTGMVLGIIGGWLAESERVPATTVATWISHLVPFP